MWRKFTLTVSLCLLAALALAAGSRAKARTQQGGQESGVVTSAPASLDLKDFGAVGDGVNDDGPALQAALDALAAAGGGTLFVPEGRYAILTPVAKSFAGLGASVTIHGVPSDTPVAPPTAPGSELSRGLDLKSEFRPRTGNQAMLVLAGLRAAAFEDIAFMGTPGVQTDASYTLAFFDIDDASIEHCEFYGLSSYTRGSDVFSVRSSLKIARTVFLGCTANSGAYTSVVQNQEWKGFTIEESIFLDYGLRPELFGKLGVAAPLSWIELGNAAAVTDDSPRREAVFRSVFLDEGGYFGIASLPARYQPPSAPIDLIYITGLRMNVSNLGTAGNHLTGARAVLIEDSAYGWSHNADAAIRIEGAAHAILDRIETSEQATRFRADITTARLSVIDSEYTDLASLAQQTVVINTTLPDQDPVRYVRAHFQSELGRAPDPAAHFYWSDKILRCGVNVACVTSARAALDAYLAASPSETFELTGKVTDENDDPVAGVTVALTGSLTATTTTGSDGVYRFSNLPTSGVYTVTPSKTLYNFPTPSKTFTNPVGDTQADFDAVRRRYAISGRVTDGPDGMGGAIAGVTLYLTGGQTTTATTDSNGNYTLTGVIAGGSYTLTPFLTGHSFTPAARSYTGLAGDQTAQNFTAVASAGGLQYYPLAYPVRLLDTRAGQPACFTPGAPVVGNTSRTQAATGTCGGLNIPANAGAVVGNAAVVNNLSGAGSGFVTLYPSGVSRPITANVNYVPGQVVSNGFTVGLGSDGAFNVYASTSLNVVIDITGYYAPPGQGGLYYHPLPKPVRLLDTRIGQAACHAPGAPIIGGVSRTESARATCSGVVLPDDAQAIVGNAAVVNPTNAGYLTVYPTGVAQPVGTTVNYTSGQIVSNAFTVRLGADGAFNIFAATTLNVVVDVSGYYSPSAAPDANGVPGLLYYQLASPLRLLDTRAGEPACSNPGLPLAAGGVRTQNARVTCGGQSVPSNAFAVVGNAAVVNTLPGALAGHLTLYPGGATLPAAANVNYAAGQIVSNSYTVGLGADGTFNIYAKSATHFVADVAGYFAP